MPKKSFIPTAHFKNQFLLDPDIAFLNHGSFGACPEPVFERYQSWQRELENQPVEFLQRRIPLLIAEVRNELGGYLGCDADELVFFPNPTTAINMVVRSLDLQAGDEILSTNHEYGAMDRTWRFICQETGAIFVQQSVPLPATSQQEITQQIWSGVTEKTKVLFVSHITSATSLIFPIEDLCRRARQAGILSIVDGAHAVGQMDLHLGDTGADIYTGACHKWLCAPKGSAFLYVNRDSQAQMLKPLVVSWGYLAEKPGPSTFIDHHDWQGTRDLAAFLSVPDAIRFQSQKNWNRERSRCQQLTQATQGQLIDLLKQHALSPASPDWFLQMCAAQLPEVDEEGLQAALYDQYKIEIPMYRWEGVPIVRPSFQVYNNQEDADRLMRGLEKLVPQYLRS